MNVALRVDASRDIGAGHVMRCLALAESLIGQGHRCVFICRLLPGNLVDRIRPAGHQVLELPAEAPTGEGDNEQGSTAYASWLGVSQLTDARQTRELLEQQGIDCLIVDHYALDHRWEQLQRPSVRRLMVIDDLADRQHECDFLLDQTPGRTASSYKGLVPEQCQLMCGAGFALLREEFSIGAALQKEPRTVATLERIFISMGGVDLDNISSRVLCELKSSDLPKTCKILVIMGELSPHLKSVQEVACGMPWETTVLVNVSNIAELMSQSDLAIGAAGVSALERCCLGLPSLVYILAENQRDGAQALQASGALKVVGDFSTNDTSLLDTIQWAQQGDSLAAMRDACFTITDGLGCSRVSTRLNDDFLR